MYTVEIKKLIDTVIIIDTGGGVRDNLVLKRSEDEGGEAAVKKIKIYYTEI